MEHLAVMLIWAELLECFPPWEGPSCEYPLCGDSGSSWAHRGPQGTAGPVGIWTGPPWALQEMSIPAALLVEGVGGQGGAGMRS